MSLRISAAGIFALLIAANGLANEDQRTRIEIAVDEDDAGERTFVFDSQDAGFDLQSMVVGESRSITDRSGTTADIRRTESGFEIDVGGETIQLPEIAEHEGLHGEHEVELLVDDDEAVVVKNVRKVKMIKSGSADGVTIISADEISPETRERIAEILTSSGLDGEIVYIDDGDIHDGEHQASEKREIRIIRKEVDVTN
ncbi:MAG: hypothetical protein ACR2RD_08705 [Woeseiaceae bacterium]